MSFSFLFPLLVTLALVGPLMAGIVALVKSKDASMNTLVQGLFAVSGLAGLIASVIAFVMTFRGTVPLQIDIPFLSSVGAFQIDALSAFFLGLINLGVFLSSIFAIGYLPRYAKTYSFPALNFASALFILGMQATVLSTSLFSFLFFWEIMSVAAYFLVIADHEEASLKAGFIYFIMTHIGAACLLGGFMLVSQGHVLATFDEARTIAMSLPMGTLGLAFFLIFAGFGSKAGLVPLHQWLPYAHPQAPSHSSALMSGVMLKVAVYGFVRVAFGVIPTIPATWAIIVILIGLLSAFFGVLYASIETDLKRLLAWSSIENMGLVFAMLGTALVLGPLGTRDEYALIIGIAAAVHCLNHTVFKSGLFLSAGAIISETHTRNLDELGGLANKWPVFSGLFLCLSLAAMALPPFGTFYGEWIYLQTMATTISQVSPVAGFFLGLIISVVALVSGLAIFTFVKTFATIFLSKARSEHADHVHPLPPTLVWPVGIAACISLGIGVFLLPVIFSFPRSVIGSISVDQDSVKPFFIFLFIPVLGVLLFLLRNFFTNRQVRVTDTWDCGQPLTPRMEYTATGFAAPIRFFFRSLVLSRKQMVTERVTPENAWILRRKLKWSTQSLWEEWMYRPVSWLVMKTAAVTKRLQNGLVQFYLVLIVATLIAVIFFTV